MSWFGHGEEMMRAFRNARIRNLVDTLSQGTKKYLELPVPILFLADESTVLLL